MSALTRRYSGTTAFWLVAYAFVATNVGGALPTPLYPAYEQRFGFGALMVTVVFAVYSAGALAALVVVGPMSDTVGRRPVMTAGLLVAVVSSAVFVAASQAHSGGVALLMVGRLLSGASVGIVTGTATAALSDLAGPERQMRASLTAATAAVLGLGLGPLLAGVLAKYAAYPLGTTYVIHLVLLGLGLVAIASVVEPVEQRGALQLRVQPLRVPAETRAVMTSGGIAGFAGFATLGLFTAVTPALLALLGHHNPALTGVVVFAVFLGSAAGQFAAARVGLQRALLIGTGSLAIGLVGVGIAIGESSLGILVAAGVFVGTAQGMSFRAALGVVTAASPPLERGAVASTFFAICYLGLSVPVIGVGMGIRGYGLVHTGEVFAAVLAGLTLVALASLMRIRE